MQHNFDKKYGWGSVIICERGWRRAIFIKPRLLTNIAEIHISLHLLQNLRLELLFDAGLRDMFFCEIPNSSFKLWPSRLLEAVKHVKFISNQFFRNLIASSMQIHDFRFPRLILKESWNIFWLLVIWGQKRSVQFLKSLISWAGFSGLQRLPGLI